MLHKALAFLWTFNSPDVRALERGLAAQQAVGAGRGARQSRVLTARSLHQRLYFLATVLAAVRCSNFLDPTLWTNYRRRTKTIEDLSE